MRFSEMGMKPGSHGPLPGEALIGRYGQGAPFCSLGTPGVMDKTHGFITMEMLHNHSVVNRDKQVPKSIHGLICSLNKCLSVHYFKCWGSRGEQNKVTACRAGEDRC